MLTRRDYLKNSALIAAASAWPASLLHAFESSELITRAIPKSGEKLPIVGLGSSATFRQVAQQEAHLVAALAQRAGADQHAVDVAHVGAKFPAEEDAAHRDGVQQGRGKGKGKGKGKERISCARA